MPGPQTAIDPFGLWPDYASAIHGLGGGAAPADPSYVFHTPYVYPANGDVTFTMSTSGLTATRGTIQVQLLAQPEAGGKLKVERTVALPVAELGTTQAFRLHTRPGVSYALRGFATEDTDAHADAMVVQLDRWGDARRYAERLERARETVFERPSKVGRGWLRRRSRVEALGLVRGGVATMADPVSQMCTAAQFDEPEFAEWRDAMHAPATNHRKLWEFVYVLQVLRRYGVMTPGSRGLGFGIGAEALPSLLAARGCAIVATDLPIEDQAASGWSATGQHSGNLSQLFFPNLVDAATFEAQVSFRPVDMTAIPRDLAGFDFCWSACAFEHLGSIEAGLRFVRESVRTLRPGGIAVHTTELNLSSDDDTVDNKSTVLFRRSDFERLALRLADDGHEVAPLCYDQGDHALDAYIDIPPYLGDAHLKIALAQYVTTSFGFTVRRKG